METQKVEGRYLTALHITFNSMVGAAESIYKTSLLTGGQLLSSLESMRLIFW